MNDDSRSDASPETTSSDPKLGEQAALSAREGRLNNHYGASAARQYQPFCRFIVGKRPLVGLVILIASFAPIFCSQKVSSSIGLSLDCNPLVVNTPEIHVVKCIYLDI
jgi:hypothetical protein